MGQSRISIQTPFVTEARDNERKNKILTSKTITANTVELGNKVSNLLDGLDLLLEVLGLDEVAQLRIIVLLSNLVEVKQALVDIYSFVR